MRCGRGTPERFGLLRTLAGTRSQQRVPRSGGFVVGLKLPLQGHNGVEVKAAIGLKSEEENIVIECNAGQRRMLNAGMSTGVSCTLMSCDVVESKTATRRKRKRLRKAGFVGCGRGDAEHCRPRAITRLDREKSTEAAEGGRQESASQRSPMKRVSWVRDE